MICRVCKTRNNNIKQFCKKCLSNMYDAPSFYTSNKPSWTSLKNNLEGLDIERKKDTSISKRAKSYEDGRKAHWAKQKPLWIKRGRKLKELNDIE